MRKWSTYVLWFVATLALSSGSGKVLAADPTTYAFLSVIGDQLEIVINEPSTGSHLDRNRHEDPVAIKDDIFDGVATMVAAQSIAKLVPGAQVMVLNSRSPVLFQNQEEVFRIKGDAITLPEAVSAALLADKATHLVLITKHRAPTRVEFADSGIGSGSLYGLGFYMDGTTRLRDIDSGKKGQGFIAPYVYARVALIDARSSRVIKTKVIAATSSVSTVDAEVATGNPWTALTPVQKINAIRSLIEQEVTRVIPLLFKTD